jgi:hypothetical protein
MPDGSGEIQRDALLATGVDAPHLLANKASDTKDDQQG